MVSGRELFSNPDALAAFVRDNRAIVHLAGMNRGDEAEIERVNIALTRQLIEACEQEHVQPHILFVNSTHYSRDTAYGRSKRRSAEMFAAWASGCGAKFTDLVCPGIFGEGGRPFYNSVVSTFCHQLANNEKPVIHQDSEVELVHAQHVAARILSCIMGVEAGEIRITGEVIRVSALRDRLNGIAEQYRAHVLPSLIAPLDLALFNTYRSYLFPKHYPASIVRRADVRGSLFEVVKTVHGGQCFFSTTLPGVTRGNHYHTAKVERFLVAQGEAIIIWRRLFTSEIIVFRVSGETPAYIDMPTFHTHSITNVGRGELLSIFWAHEIFDPERPDTFPEPVEP